MKKEFLLFSALSILLCFTPRAEAQNSRFSGPYPSVSSSTQVPYLVANVAPNLPILAVCAHPANATPCTNYVTTYADATTSTPCSNGAQDSPDPQPSACQSTGDAQGNIAFWAPPGEYDYTICIQNTVSCFGPYTVTLGTTNASGVSFATPGQGAMIGPNLGALFPLYSTSSVVSDGILSATANQITVFQFTLPYSITISRVSTIVGVASSGQTANFGIYSASGVKMLDSGALSTTSMGAVHATITPVTLPAGVYYYAQSASSSGPEVISIPGYSVAATNMLNALSTKVGQAANSTSAGVMPSTLGTITADSVYPNLALALFEP